jgi:hypothetical protein
VSRPTCRKRTASLRSRLLDARARIERWADLGRRIPPADPDHFERVARQLIEESEDLRLAAFVLSSPEL